MTVAPAWAHESPVTLARFRSAYDLGQSAVLEVMMPMLRRAEACVEYERNAADYWYLRANNTPAEIAEMLHAALTAPDVEEDYWSRHADDLLADELLLETYRAVYGPDAPLPIPAHQEA